MDVRVCVFDLINDEEAKYLPLSLQVLFTDIKFARSKAPLKKQFVDGLRSKIIRRVEKGLPFLTSPHVKDEELVITSGPAFEVKPVQLESKLKKTLDSITKRRVRMPKVTFGDVTTSTDAIVVNSARDMAKKIEEEALVANVTINNWMNISLGSGITTNPFIPKWWFSSFVPGAPTYLKHMSHEEFITVLTGSTFKPSAQSWYNSDFYDVRIYLTIPNDFADTLGDRRLKPGAILSVAMTVTRKFLEYVEQGTPINLLVMEIIQVLDETPGKLNLMAGIATHAKVDIIKDSIFPCFGDFDVTMNLVTEAFNKSSTIGIIANKGSGKTKLATHFAQKGFIVHDSDDYGQLLSVMVERKLTIKDLPSLFDFMDMFKLEIKEAPSIFEVVAQKFIKDSKLTFSNMLDPRFNLRRYLTKFNSYIYNHLTQVTLPFRDYMAAAGWNGADHTQKHVFFGHAFEELKGLMGMGIFSVDVSFDNSLAIMSRIRSTDVTTDLFLYRFYDHINDVSTYTIPLPILHNALNGYGMASAT